MYLEKLDIQGFKSFANKNTLVFPGMLDHSRRGITAVVGPNGSGKSNVADAIRWCLGEQSMKALRGKKSEDVIFSGSDKKSKLSMAEVSLYLNNEDGQAPVNYSQIVLTRRLYRDGESEYLLNNSRARLSDIQILLSRAKFGQKTYSVIGQGVVEGFLNSSLAERKEFFDEATGVKQFQIKRDESLNKLRNSLENLSQAQMLVNEIEPRLKSLTRQVARLQKRGLLESELKELQRSYYSKNWHEIDGKFHEISDSLLNLERGKLEQEKKIANLNRGLRQMELQNKENAEFVEAQSRLNQLQIDKDAAVKQLAKLEAQLEVKLEARGQFDLAFFHNKKRELASTLEKISEDCELLQNNLANDKQISAELEQEKQELDKKISALNEKLASLETSGDRKENQAIKEQIKQALNDLIGLETETDLAKIKQALLLIKNKLAEAAALFDKEDRGENRENIHLELSQLIKEKESLHIKINGNFLRLSARGERTKLLEEKKREISLEIKNIEDKLQASDHPAAQAEDGAKQQELVGRLKSLEEEIKNAKEKINLFSSAETAKRAQLFALQKNLQTLQRNLNDTTARLNELRISSTRFETKLEDLEIEIRNSYGDLMEIKEFAVDGPVENELAMQKIEQLKRQLDQIGGIDPEAEKEYLETKERFDFLFGQINDLNSAIGSLEKVITELDLTIKERFDKEFKIISEKFDEYFKILFNGGVAKIIKVMADEAEAEEEKELAAQSGEELEPRAEGKKTEMKKTSELTRIKFLQKHNATGLAGIEIQATPPGKKIKSIAMLSGGERALTAIALICAIISANPSPFVVLDEVDAALDEANSERLAKILDDLSHRTQFIVITHNRASMRRANILYGITMGDDSVSKLLSIKLEEANAKFDVNNKTSLN